MDIENYLKRIFDNDLSIQHGVYEPPNNIPILRYKYFKEKYEVIILGSSDMVKSCIRWLSTENIVPSKTLSTPLELDTLDKNKKYFIIIADPNYKYVSYQSLLLKKMAENNIFDYLCPYDYEKIPKHETIYLEYFEKNQDKLIEMAKSLHDDESRRVYAEYIRSKAFCDFYRLEQLPTWKKYFDEDIYIPLPEETFVNCGSSNGDTIFYFLERYNEFNRIYALEGDKNRHLQCKSNIELLNEDIKDKITCINTFVDNGHNQIDDIISSNYATLINMDIEGMELEALRGAKKIIVENKPVIAACAYHLPTDLYELPMFIKSLSNQYEIFYRKYASTVRNRFCNAELVMYAVPQKRLIK